MIFLYRPANCDCCAVIEAALKEMVIAHRVIVVEPGAAVDELPGDLPLPALKDGARFITGRAAIEQHLQKLQHIMQQWQKFQSDACYWDDDGSVC